MAHRLTKAQQIVDRILAGASADDRMADLRRRLPADEPLPPSVPGKQSWSAASVEERRALLRDRGFTIDHLAAGGTGIDPESLRGNIEGLVGFAQVPVGVIGPLRINGSEASGDYYVPLATTEGALVASYHRGSRLVSEAGGATVLCLAESVFRAPCFVFRGLAEAGRFLAYALPRFEELAARVGELSRHACLVDLRASLGGKEAYLLFEYTTGDAAGQNMVTIATEDLCRRLVEGSPIRPEHWYIEGNMSGDKKATQQALGSARGKKVVADVTIPGSCPNDPPCRAGRPRSVLAGRHPRFRPERRDRHDRATRQTRSRHSSSPAARMRPASRKLRSASRGWTSLPKGISTRRSTCPTSSSAPSAAERTCRRRRSASRCSGARETGSARRFAEICAATVLAGEISITGALASGEFSRAHAVLGRKPGS